MQLAGAEGVIDRQLLQLIATQTVKPAIADMVDVNLPSPADQRGEGAGHVLQILIASPDGMNPTVDRFQAANRGFFRQPMVRKAEVSVEEASHREFRSDAATLGTADAVSDRGDNAETQISLMGNRCKVFIRGAATLLAEKSRSHEQNCVLSSAGG